MRPGVTCRRRRYRPRPWPWWGQLCPARSRRVVLGPPSFPPDRAPRLHRGIPGRRPRLRLRLRRRLRRWRRRFPFLRLTFAFCRKQRPTRETTHFHFGAGREAERSSPSLCLCLCCLEVVLRPPLPAAAPACRATALMPHKSRTEAACGTTAVICGRGTDDDEGVVLRTPVPA